MFDPGENSILLISLTLMKHKKETYMFLHDSTGYGRGGLQE